MLLLGLAVVSLFYGQMGFAQFEARDEKKANALCELGDAELAKGHIDKAKSCFIEANLYNNTDARIMWGLAKVAEKKGDLDEAIRRAQLAAQYDSMNPSVHVVLAYYLEKNQDFRGAELQYERAVDLVKSKQESVPFCSRVIKYLIELEDFERAEKLSKAWLKEHAGYAQSHYDRGLVLMHSARQVNQQEALKQFGKALDLDPRLNIVHYQLGVLYGKMGRKELALGELSTFVESHPMSGDVKLAQEQIEKLKGE